MCVFCWCTIQNALLCNSNTRQPCGCLGIWLGCICIFQMLFSCLFLWFYLCTLPWFIMSGARERGWCGFVGGRKTKKKVLDKLLFYTFPCIMCMERKMFCNVEHNWVFHTLRFFTALYPNDKNKKWFHVDLTFFLRWWEKKPHKFLEMLQTIRPKLNQLRLYLHTHKFSHKLVCLQLLQTLIHSA